jgi:hypothetical protein
MARPRQPDQEPGPCREPGCQNDTRYFPGGPEDRFNGMCRQCYNSYKQGRKSAAAIAKRKAKLPSNLERIIGLLLDMKDDGFLSATEADIIISPLERKLQAIRDTRTAMRKNDRIFEQSENQAGREAWKHTEPATPPPTPPTRPASPPIPTATGPATTTRAPFQTGVARTTDDRPIETKPN